MFSNHSEFVYSNELVLTLFEGRSRHSINLHNCINFMHQVKAFHFSNPFVFAPAGNDYTSLLTKCKPHL